MIFSDELLKKLENAGYIFVKTNEEGSNLNYCGDYLLAEAHVVTHNRVKPKVTITRMDGVGSEVDQTDVLLSRTAKKTVDPETFLRAVAGAVDALDRGLNDAYEALAQLK